MKAFVVEQTEKSPRVVLDHEINLFKIEGISILKEAETFYSPIIQWLDSYGNEMKMPLILDVKLEFFNIQSSRKILRIFYKLEELLEKGLDVSIRWFYGVEKDHIHEAGLDYACMLDVPFLFESFSFPKGSKELVNF